MLAALSAARECNDLGIETLDELNHQAGPLLSLFHEQKDVM